MAESKYVAVGAIAAVALTAGAFWATKGLTDYFEKKHRRHEVEHFVKKLFGDNERVQSGLDKLSDADIQNLLRVSSKLRDFKDSATDYAASAKDSLASTVPASIDKLRSTFGI